jgi:multiple sugar transport system substrate-binding protein
MRNSTRGILAGLGLMLASSTSVMAQELTIFWAEWDPANYLGQRLHRRDGRYRHGADDAVA